MARGAGEFGLAGVQAGIAFWEVGARKADRAERRWKRPRMFPRPERVGPVTLSDGAALEALYDDEAVPDMSSSIRKPCPHFPFIHSDSDREAAKGSGATSANPTTPKRVGDEPTGARRPLDAPQPLDDPVRRRGQHDGSAMRPFGLNSSFRRETTCRDIDHGCRVYHGLRH